MTDQSNETVFPPRVRAALAPGAPVLTVILGRFSNALAVYAFGSHVQGTAGPDSDLDLAVLVAGYADQIELWELAASLTDVVGCLVDLLDLRAASTVMQYQVVMTGRRLWAKGVEADLFECFVLSEKTALDAARSGLLSDIQATGRIHAR